MNAISIAGAVLLVLQPITAPTPAQKPAAATPAAAAAKPAPNELPVTITYKGKGTVDATHKLYVWLFADPNITSASRPITQLAATKNGETLVFKDVTTSPVYLFAVYDTTGSYDGVSGPPPAGVPSGPYRTAAKGTPAAVKSGAAIKFAFDDSEPWNK
jgi:hypothetical protein